MSSELVKREESEAPANILQIIGKAAADPNLDVEKYERLCAMYERLKKAQAEASFNAALSRIQARLSPIGKDGSIIVKGQLRSKWAKHETIDAALRPLIDAESMALSFDTDDVNGQVKLISKLAHKDGHSEVKSLVLPIDKSEFRSNVQNVGSTLSYGKRQLTKMWFNIIETDEDDDGQGGGKLISEDQEKTLETMLSDAKANRAGFLKYMGVEKIADIPVRDFNKAVASIEAKLRQQR